MAKTKATLLREKNIPFTTVVKGKVVQKNSNVCLMKNGDMFEVLVDGDKQYESANELFATQRWNAI